MPTYQYACTACAERLEVVQSFTDDPLTECPACGGTLRKVFSPVGVVFKGSGFYKTDSRSKPASSATSSSSSSSSDGASSSSDGASTPAAAPATPPSTGSGSGSASGTGSAGTAAAS